MIRLSLRGVVSRIALAGIFGAAVYVFATTPAPAAVADCDPAAAACFFVHDAARPAWRAPATTGSVRVDRCETMTGHGSRLDFVGGCGADRAAEAPTRAEPVASSISSAPENLNDRLR